MRIFWVGIAAALFVIPGVAGSATPAGPPPVADIQRLLDERIADNPGTGIIVGIIDHGRETVLQAGTSGTPRALDAHSLFEVGSVTKTFTATALADMVLNHEVALTDPVGKYLPASTHVPSHDGKPITLLSLATQHSGLPRMPSNFDPKNAEDPYADYSYARLEAFLNTYALPRDPGATFEYSNLGVSVLGDALADEAHESYQQLIQSRILTPLGMDETSSLPVAELAPALRTLLTAGHSDAGDVAHAWNFQAMAPAGAIRSNVADMLRYVRCNLGIGPIAHDCLYAQQPRDTLPGNHIGLIWWTSDETPIVHHGGDTFGFHSAVAISPDHQRGVVVLTNGGDDVDTLAQHIVDRSVQLPVRDSLFPVAAADLDAYAGSYHYQGIGFTFRRGPRGMTAQLDGQPAITIFPDSKDHFYYTIVAADLTFTRNTDGSIDGVILHQNGRRILYLRDGVLNGAHIEPPPPPVVNLDAATLTEYIGVYRAAPEMTFTVAADGSGGLTVQLTGQPAFPLFASARDRFFLKVVDARIEFKRDSSGRVSTLVLHQSGHLVSASRL